MIDKLVRVQLADGAALAVSLKCKFGIPALSQLFNRAGTISCGI